jgi:hypothetical protein
LKYYELKDQGRRQTQQKNEYISEVRKNETQYKRSTKDEKAEQLLFENVIMRRERAFRNQQKREEKESHIKNLKDVEEFKRGVQMADICLENEKFRLWKYGLHN